MTARNLALEMLVAPQRAPALSMAEWDLLVRQARRANLLASLAHRLRDRGLIDAVPQAPRLHLESALCVSDRQALAVRWEVRCLQQAFRDAAVPLVLLKGAAYLMADLPASKGRVFADVDLIVPRQRIVDAESALMQHGWRGAELSPYDQRYYRRWMHEIPPMTHVRRGTTVDLHHSILPEVARIKVDAHRLLEGVRALDSAPGVQVLQPVDMVVHSATHLFQEGEFENGLRDLFDLDSLLRHFGSTIPGFWEALVPRARALGVARLVHHALRYAAMLVGTPVPDRVLAESAADRPPTPARRMLDACYARALRPVHPSLDKPSVRAARLALYLRSHWIRMPPGLLGWHLGRKLVLHLFERRPDASAPDAQAAR